MNIPKSSATFGHLRSCPNYSRKLSKEGQECRLLLFLSVNGSSISVGVQAMQETFLAQS